MNNKTKAIKTIRMTLIEEFSAFFEKNRMKYDFKMIFLVRDPRGMMNSRLHVAGVEHPLWVRDQQTILLIRQSSKCLLSPFFGNENLC